MTTIVLIVTIRVVMFGKLKALTIRVNITVTRIV